MKQFLTNSLRISGGLIMPRSYGVWRTVAAYPKGSWTAPTAEAARQPDAILRSDVNARIEHCIIVRLYLFGVVLCIVQTLCYYYYLGIAERAREDPGIRLVLARLDSSLRCRLTTDTLTVYTHFRRVTRHSYPPRALVGLFSGPLSAGDRSL